MIGIMSNRKSVNKDLEAPLLEKSNPETHEIDIETSGLVDENETETVIDTNQYNLFDHTFICGFLVGAALQFLSIYVDGTLEALIRKTRISTTIVLQRPHVPYPVVLISEYWRAVGMFLPPIVTILIQRYRMRKSTKTKAKSSIFRRNMESFLDCTRFQFGMLLGSLCQMGLLNLYFVARFAPPALLGCFFSACMVASLFIMWVFHTCVNQTCAHVSSVEVNIHCDKDEEACL